MSEKQKRLKKQLETIDVLKAFAKYKGITFSQKTKDKIDEIELQAIVEEPIIRVALWKGGGKLKPTKPIIVEHDGEQYCSVCGKIKETFWRAFNLARE